MVQRVITKNSSWFLADLNTSYVLVQLKSIIDTDNIFMNLNDASIKEMSSLGISAINKIRAALLRDDVNSLSALLRVKGIGAKSIEKLLGLLKMRL